MSERDKVMSKRDEIRRYLIAVFGQPMDSDHERQLEAHIECAELWGDYYHAKQNAEAEKCDIDIRAEDIGKVPSGDLAQWETELRSLCQEIEKLPASEQQTAISVRASTIYQSLAEFNRYCDDQFEEMKKARPDLFGKQAEGGELEQAKEMTKRDKEVAKEGAYAEYLRIPYEGHRENGTYKDAIDLGFEAGIAYAATESQTKWRCEYSEQNPAYCQQCGGHEPLCRRRFYLEQAEGGEE